MPLRALILAGGKSRRLGRDKAAESIGGNNLLARTAFLAASLCPEVWISGRDPAPHGLNLHWIADTVPGLGPMGGVATGLERLRGPLLVLACDMPLLNAPVLETLVRHRNLRPPGTAATTYIQAETGFLESLVAIYEEESLSLIRNALSRRDYKLANAIPRQRLHTIPYTREQALPFFNINFPQDMAMLDAYLRLHALHPSTPAPETAIA